MRMKISRGQGAFVRILSSAGLLAALAPALIVPLRGSVQGEVGSLHYVYVSDKRVISLELINERKAILNYINLDDVMEVLQSTNLLLIDAAGGTYRGHVFLNEDGDAADSERYRVTDLVGPSEYRGYDVLGNFRFEAAPARAYLRLGSRIVKLQPLTSDEFDVFATNVGEIDLEAENRKQALADAGFWQGFGEMYEPGEEEAREIASRMPEQDPFPPVLIASPAPTLLPRYADLPDPVIVRLRVKVTRAGGILDAKVDDGINPELDELAVQVVMNSWEILPAISENRPADAELVLRVQFER